MQESRWRSDYKNYTPGKRDLQRIQDNYRQISIGYAPFMPTWRIGGYKALLQKIGFSNLAYKQTGETLDSSYFYWGPKIGTTGEPYIKAMHKKRVAADDHEESSLMANTDPEYARDTMYPWVSNAYKASYQYAGLMGRFTARTQTAFGRFTEPLPGFRKEDTKNILGILSSGITPVDKLEDLQANLEPDQKEKLFSNDIRSMDELVKTLDNIQGTLQGKSYKIDKAGLNLGGKKKYNPRIGGKGLGGGSHWIPSEMLWSNASDMLSEALVGDIMNLNRDDKEQKGEEDNINYWAEATEELGLSLIMDTYGDLLAYATSGNKSLLDWKKDPNAQQMVVGSTIGSLPDSLRLSKAGGTRNAVDVAQNSAEHSFMAEVAGIDNQYAADLRAILGLDHLWDEALAGWKDPKKTKEYIEGFTGHEITQMHIDTKGGYKNIKIDDGLGTVDNPLKDEAALSKRIDDINKEQVKLINKVIKKHGDKIENVLGEIEKANKKLAKKEGGSFNIADQTRQSLSRMVHAEYLGRNRFGFTAPFHMSMEGEDKKVNGMVGFVWEFGWKNNSATPGTPKVVTFSGKGYETPEGLKILGILDLIMAAIANSADEALNWKADVFMDRLVNAATRKKGIEDILFEQLVSINYLDIVGQVGGAATMSYKLPTTIAKELGEEWENHLQKMAGDAEFMGMVEDHVKLLSRDWRNDLGMTSWGGEMLQGGPSWFTPHGSGSPEAYAVPFMAGGRAGAGADPTKKSTIYKGLRLWSP